jgi:hypothetical protein
MEAVYFSKLSVNFYQSTWHHIQVEGVDISLKSCSAFCQALLEVVAVVVALADLSEMFVILWDIAQLYVQFAVMHCVYYHNKADRHGERSESHLIPFSSIFAV